MQLIFGFRYVLKYSLLLGSGGGLLLMIVLPVWGFLSSWDEAIEAISKEYPSDVKVLTSRTNGVVHVNGELSRAKRDSYLLIPSNITIDVLKIGETPLEIKMEEGGVGGLLAVVVMLIAVFFFFLRFWKVVE